MLRQQDTSSWHVQALMSDGLASYPGRSKSLCFNFLISKVKCQNLPYLLGIMLKTESSFCSVGLQSRSGTTAPFRDHTTE